MLARGGLPAGASMNMLYYGPAVAAGELAR